MPGKTKGRLTLAQIPEKAKFSLIRTRGKKEKKTKRTKEPPFFESRN